jgi:hypothetical protein
MRRITKAKTKHPGSLRTTVLAFSVLSSGMLVAGGALELASPVEAAGIADDDWLGVVNAYRAQSGLEPVVENTSQSAGARNHSCWMLLNGIAHDEPSGTPGYTSSGDAAGNASNVAVSSDSNATARYYVDLWMSAPFHAVGVLRNSLQSTAFGKCANPSATPWKSAGTLDVIRGNDWSIPDPTSAIVFPGDGATTSLTRFIAESPDPRTFCGWTGQAVGLPLIALMPAGVSSASASLSGPSGPISTCVLHKENTSGVAKSILGGDNAVVVLPSAPLQTGPHTASVSSNGGNVTWTFNVDPDAPLTDGTEPPPPPELPELRDTTVLADKERMTSITPFRFADSRVDGDLGRLAAGTTVRIAVAGQRGIPTDASSISANFTVDQTSGNGFLTASGCGDGVHDVSTLNYTEADTVANQAIVPLATNGDLCLYSHASADVIIDINGYATESGPSKLVSVTPTRLVDTRGGTALRAGILTSFVLGGPRSPVPPDASAVLINVTAVDPQSTGWIVAYPCGVAEPQTSTINVSTGGTRANSAILPISADGKVCLRSTTTTDILIDVTGWMGSTGSHEFTPLRPMRTSDTRSLHPQLNTDADGQPLDANELLRIPIAGVRGIPGSAEVATLNVTVAGAVNDGFLRVVPCGTSTNTSTVNFRGGLDVANGITVKLGPDGDVCVSTSATTHVIVDITGIWD